MSFDTFNNKPISQKNILVEIDTGQDYDKFISAEPGIWKWAIKDTRTTDFSYGFGAFGYGDYESSGDATLLGSNAVEYNIESLNVDGTTYTKLSSYATLQADDGSAFYYNVGTFTLYIKFVDLKQYWEFTTIAVGISSGYASFEGVYNNFLYPAKIESIPNLKYKADSLKYGIMSLTGGTINLNNTDGSFDDFAQGDVYGQEIRILYGSPELAYSDYVTLFTGYIDDFTLDLNSFRIQVYDQKGKFDRLIPLHNAEVATYPDISEDNENAPIPIAYGEVNGAVAVCLNDDEAPAPANYDFIIVYPHHSIQSINSIEVEEVGTVASATDLDACTFSLAAADYSPGDEVIVSFNSYVDGSGNLIENGLDVLKDMLDVFLDISYSSDTFNTGAWASATTDAPDIALYVNDSEEIKKSIENILNSLRGTLVIEGDGKISFKFYKETLLPESTIEKDETKFQQLDYDRNDMVSAVEVLYKQNYFTENWRRYVDRDSEDAFFSTYKKRPYQEFETLLQDEEDAILYADEVIDQHSTMRPKVKWQEKMRNSQLELYDIVDVYINRERKNILGLARVVILEKTINLKTFLTTFTGRVIAEIDTEEFGFIWEDGGAVLQEAGGRFKVIE